MSETDQPLVTNGLVPVPQGYDRANGRYKANESTPNGAVFAAADADANAYGQDVVTFTALSSTPRLVKASRGLLTGVNVQNPNNADVFLQWFDAADDVVVGTTTPKFFQVVPAHGALDGPPCAPPGIGFAAAISVAATTTPTGAVAPGVALPISVFYK